MSVLSTRAVEATKIFFGPAAEPFLVRQCKGHLKVDLPDLSREHLKELAKWVEIAAKHALDEDRAKQLANNIAAL